MSPTVIELGDVSRPAGPFHDDPLPSVDRRLARRLRIAAVAVLCAFTLGAAVPAGPGAVRQMWELRFDRAQAITLAGDVAFVHRRIDEEAVLTAYHLPTGVPRWSQTTGHDLGGVEFRPEAEVLLLNSGEATARRVYQDGSSGELLFYRETVALDPATGDRLWTRPGQALASGAGGVLLEEVDATGAVTAVGLVRARDGEPVWRRPVTGMPTATVSYRDGQPHRIVTATERGELTVLRYADGSLLGNRQVPWAATVPSSGRHTLIRTAGDRLVVARSGPQQSTVTAYDIDTLGDLWRTVSGPFLWIQDCGKVLCLIGHHSLSGLDPATGRTRWETPEMAVVTWTGGGRLLVSDSADPPRQYLLDAADGSRVGPGGIGQAYAAPDATDAALLLRPAASPAGHTAVSRLDLHTGETRLLGAMPTAHEFGCDASGTYLLCRSADRLIVTAAG